MPTERPETEQYKLQNSEVNHKRTVLLCTIHKSGTHWSRYLFANYMQLLSGLGEEPITYKRLQRRVGNNRSYILCGRKPWVSPARFVRRAGVRDFLWQHYEDDLAAYKGAVMLQFRNPLDTLISRYHYDLERWRTAGRNVNGPMSCLFVIEEFAQKYAEMRAMARRRPNTIMVSYESLRAATVPLFEILLRFLGMPVNRDLIYRAVAHSDINNIRKEEAKRGRAIVAPTSSGSFVRDGSIGQWRSVLSDQDIQQIEAILMKYEVDLNEFDLGGDRRDAVELGQS